MSDRPLPDRRAALRRLGIAAGGVALSGYTQAGCDDGADSAETPTGGAPPVAMDAGPPPADADGGPDAPDLEPIRGDGSHPFHYIDTVVVVQMENRSFDHMLGSLSLLEGREDIDGLREGMSNAAADGTPIAIHHLVDRYVIEPDPPHGWTGSQRQHNAGANDGFVRAYEASDHPTPEDLPNVMGYYTRDDLPVMYALSDAFTLCQNWHSGVLTSTWPNRFFSHCASSDGLKANNGSCSEPTPYVALEAAGLTWKTYFSNLYFTLLIDDHKLTPAAKTDAFFEQAAAGTLPNVCIVEPAFFVNDDHPPADVRMGQAWLHTVYEALRQSPQWHRTLLVVFYDECGGFFDHKPPPESRGDTRAAEGFDRVGFRVPGLVIGPLARRGYVLDTVVEHSSVPALISRVFGLPHVNARSEQAGDLAAALDLSYVSGAARPAPPSLEAIEVPLDTLEQALRADSGQPELIAWMRRMGLAHHDSLPERRRIMRRILEHGKRLGTMKFKVF